MKVIKYLLVGFVFGIVLTKSEAVSWYRIYEMFQFQSFHMYGIIMTASPNRNHWDSVDKRKSLKDIKGLAIEIQDKEQGSTRYWVGGLFFGFGWALVGSCPGPIFILLGCWTLVLIVFFGALLGTYIYGVLKDKLPH
jgi:uncharacterized membrane protein YedE/YeeE